MEHELIHIEGIVQHVIEKWAGEFQYRTGFFQSTHDWKTAIERGDVSDFSFEVTIIGPELKEKHAARLKAYLHLHENDKLGYQRVFNTQVREIGRMLQRFDKHFMAYWNDPHSSQALSQRFRTELEHTVTLAEAEVSKAAIEQCEAYHRIIKNAKEFKNKRRSVVGQYSFGGVAALAGLGTSIALTATTMGGGAPSIVMAAYGTWKAFTKLAQELEDRYKSIDECNAILLQCTSVLYKILFDLDLNALEDAKDVDKKKKASFKRKAATGGIELGSAVLETVAGSVVEAASLGWGMLGGNQLFIPNIETFEKALKQMRDKLTGKAEKELLELFMVLENAREVLHEVANRGLGEAYNPREVEAAAQRVRELDKTVKEQKKKLEGWKEMLDQYEKIEAVLKKAQIKQIKWAKKYLFPALEVALTLGVGLGTGAPHMAHQVAHMVPDEATKVALEVTHKAIELGEEGIGDIVRYVWKGSKKQVIKQGARVISFVRK